MKLKDTVACAPIIQMFPQFRCRGCNSIVDTKNVTLRESIDDQLQWMQDNYRLHIVNDVSSYTMHCPECNAEYRSGFAYRTLAMNEHEKNARR